jgi:hypothetical protein
LENKNGVNFFIGSFVHDSQTGDKFCVGPGIDGAAHVFPDGSILDMVLRIWFLKKHPYHFLK